MNVVHVLGWTGDQARVYSASNPVTDGIEAFISNKQKNVR